MLVCGRAGGGHDRTKVNIIHWKDLAPSKNFVFGPMKEGLRGKHYASDHEVKTTMMKWFKEHLTE